MGFYVLANGQGEYIRHDKGTGKYVKVRSFNQAMQFPDSTRAESILRSSVSKAIRVGFYAEHHDTEDIVNRDNIEKQNEICFRAIDVGEISEWQEKISQIQQLIAGIDTRFDTLVNNLSNVDQEITDVEHYIEFGKFNCYQGWLCFKMLKNLLQQRRHFKNELQVLSKIKECKIQSNSLGSLFHNIKEIQDKVYTPRKFPELFKGGNS